MVWQKIIGRARKFSQRSGSSVRRRQLRLERMERREVLASNIGAIAGIAFVDQGNDGSSVGDPPVLVDGLGDLVPPGTPGATGITVQLFEDTNTNGAFDSGSDLLVGSLTTDLDGNYRFDGLTVGTYFLTQQAVPQLTTPASVTVQVTNESGVQAVLIDDFSSTTQSVTANASSTVDDSVAAPEAIGGERGFQVTNATAGGQVTAFADGGSGTLSIGALGAASGTILIQYDGPDGTLTLDPVGLGNESFAGGAAADPTETNSGLVVMTRSQAAGDTLDITIFTDAGNSSTTSIVIPQDPSNVIETFVPFSSFSVATGVGANFNDVGAIEATVGLSTNNDVFVEIVETIRPDVVSANYANLSPITLGGEIFLDNSAANQNNGVREGTEPGVTGVVVQLHQLANANDVVDLATSVPTATTTTGANGAYSFANLEPGHYAVVIPATEFQFGAPLFGFSSSTGNDPAPDPDDDVDGDDNGTADVSGAVVTGTISLVSNAEPIDDGDADSNTNTTLDLGFVPEIDLSITKSLDVASSTIIAGGTAVFDIVVQNDGPLDATNVQVEDILPAGLTYAGIQNSSGSFTPNVAGSTVTIDLGTVPASGAANFQLIASIGANETADITNTATVSGTEVDSDPSDNSDNELLDLIATDLTIVKSDSPDPANAGDQLTYTITVTNDGPDNAGGVQVTDQLPVGVDFSSGDVDGDTNLIAFDSGTRTVTATVGALANAGTSVITIVVDVQADADGPLSNTAVVTATPNTDPNSSNNTSTADTTIDRIVDVGVSKTVAGTEVAGTNVTYTIDVTNAGPGQARGVSVVDVLDAGLTFDAASFNGGAAGVTVSENGQELTFTVGTLDSGTNAEFSFDVAIGAAATGTIENLATVSTSDTDNNAANDTSNISIDVQQEVDLILTKDVDLATAVPGSDQLVYTFTIEHDVDSVSDAANVVMTDLLPAGVIGAVIDAPTALNTSFDNGTVTVEYATIPIGSTETFTVTVDTEADATGSVVNSGTVTSSGTELDSANNTDDATTVLTPDFDVTISKAVDVGSPGPNDAIVYTVGLANTGPSTAPGVILTDTIPAGLTFVSGSLDGQAAVDNGATLSFPAISIAPGGTATATLNFTVDSSSVGAIVNTASVNDLSAEGENDATNNSATANIDVIPLVDLAITKSVSALEAQVGDNLTYTIDVVNSGPSTAENVNVQDTLPAGVSFVSGTGPSGEVLTEVGGVVDFAAGDVASGESLQLTILVTIPGGSSGDQVNSVSVSTTTNDGDANNNAASATTNVDPLTATIGGSVYTDENNDGVRDAGELGIEGVVITLTGTDSLGNSVDIAVSTDYDVLYQFANLASGTYVVTETQPIGIRDGITSLGTGATAVASDNVFSDLALGQAANAVDFNFGELGVIFSKRRFLASST
ncbi:MAG: SdrD B-like domain-containing protein [Rubripirellula sp.]|nr:SdrD B-like domain-containing protein [Rubripirellula sp.]